MEDFGSTGMYHGINGKSVQNMEKMKNNLPEEMLAVRQHEADGKLLMEKVPVPRPGPGEVLIKIAASPINPSDLGLLKGGYLNRSYPFTPGLEGSGTVIESGGGLLGSLRKGKRVACSPDPEGDGTWAEYMKTSVMRTLPLPGSVSLEQGAMMLVNPMTALAFLHLARKEKHQAMVNNAAASSLGKMLIRLCAEKEIPLINIVRKEEQRLELQSLGAKHVLNSSENSFETELKQLASKLDASLFLDAVGGQQSALLLAAAPPRSTLIVYARLSGETLQADPGDLIRKDKRIMGFQLGNWLNTKGILFKLSFVNQVKKKLSGALFSRVNQEFAMNEVEEAIRYYREHMSEGKILLKPINVT
jgi:NADPH:quinone reductase-like Zn-dependent oxidoreductase